MGAIRGIKLKKNLQIFAHEDMGEGDSSLNFFCTLSQCQSPLSVYLSPFYL